MVQVIKDYKGFKDAIDTDKLVVIDCFAMWCGPCKAVAPAVQKFSEEFTNVAFFKVDVDEVPDVAQELNIRAMPTFVFFKNGEKITTVVGANPVNLKNQIIQYAA
ncbi:thioredoxin trx1 [Rhizina undulata]